jgi:hypothetical protein
MLPLNILEYGIDFGPCDEVEKLWYVCSEFNVEAVMGEGDAPLGVDRVWGLEGGWIVILGISGLRPVSKWICGGSTRLGGERVLGSFPGQITLEYNPSKANRTLTGG